MTLRRTCRCTEFHRVKNANLRHPPAMCSYMCRIQTSGYLSIVLCALRFMQKRSLYSNNNQKKIQMPNLHFCSHEDFYTFCSVAVKLNTVANRQNFVFFFATASKLPAGRFKGKCNTFNGNFIWTMCYRHGLFFFI